MFNGYTQYVAAGGVTKIFWTIFAADKISLLAKILEKRLFNLLLIVFVN